jgi:hypothetical protein
MHPTYDSIVVNLSRVQKHIVSYERVAPAGRFLRLDLSEL